MESRPQVIHQHPRSFLSTLALGISSIAGIALIAAMVLGIYGLRIVDQKTDLIFGTADRLVSELPEICEALPPLLADVFEDERRPDYAGELEIESRLVRRSGRGGIAAQIEVTNGGEDLVTLLSVHVTASDGNGRLISEWNEWVATPVALDDDLRGPLMPGSTRTLLTGRFNHLDGLPVEGLEVAVEITDVRIWQRKPTEVARGF